jgi:flagellar hook protein FlgE
LIMMHAFPPSNTTVPLSLAAGQRIISPALEPVLGWTGDESAGVAEILIFPQDLLKTCATQNIAYACNLPAPEQKTAQKDKERPAKASSGARKAEAKLLASSLLGGQISIIAANGNRNSIGFRWACVSGQPATGFVWRCFVQLSTPASAGPWTALGQDYVFDPSSGALLDGPASIRAGLKGCSLTITHPEGMLTCLPAQAELVKITRLTADGRAKRELESLALHPDRSIVARFSDGAKAKIATAAPASVAPALAA